MPPLTQKLAQQTLALRYEDLPPVVVHEVKRRLIDSLGVALSAWNSPPGRIARKLALQASQSKGATVLGTTHRTTVDRATFYTGTLIRYWDYNDTYLSKEPAHPSDNISACLSVADAEATPPKDLITSIVIAYEVQCRLCDAESLRTKGWDHVTYGAFSASLASAYLMKLDINQTAHALALSGIANIALRQTRVGELSEWKASAFANTARNAVFATLLAREGLTGPLEIFEGVFGFWKLVAGPFDINLFEKGHFKILDTYLKKYPAEYHAQSAISAALTLRKQIPDLSAIREIHIYSHDAAVDIIGSEPEKWRPQTRETADHSLPYCVAIALKEGKVSLEEYTPYHFHDPDLLALLDKIKVHRDSSCSRLYPQAIPNIVEIITQEGKTFRERVDYPRGHPQNPMTDQEIEEKFYRLTSPLLTEEQQRRILDYLWHLETQTSLEPLMEYLRCPPIMQEAD